MGMGMVMGVDPLISQAFGAGDRVRARNVLWQGIWLALIVAGVLTLVLLGAAAALPYIGAEPELVPPARTFLLIRMLSLVPFLTFFAMRSYLQAHGTTRPLLISMIVANIANFLLDLLSRLRRKQPSRLDRTAAVACPPSAWPARRWRPSSVPILQLVIVARAAFAIEVPGPVDHRWDSRRICQAARVGLPLGLQMGAEVGIFALVGVLASRLGTLHLAAHQLVISIASFTFTVALGRRGGSVRSRRSRHRSAQRRREHARPDTSRSSPARSSWA